MDFLLIFFYIVLVAIVAAPFVYVSMFAKHIPYETDPKSSELFDRRDVLLDNLKDLKIEFDTGKLTETEFKSISSGLVKELEEQDKRISQDAVITSKAETSTKPQLGGKFCHNCGFKIEIFGAKFCPECGTKLQA
ncbi:zinc ribbon domain-containing protein [Leptospira andrefontaineae]|uniref:Zinc ribbon domain-containing protein n=1 Tax=Leptospira andrefontaineae TaxID=2484976 RepID=A0A4V3JGE2_9LEPT|nr:zinc ribbon domain-containing protein [Leptospira andrefontaineae]TGK42343.1 zinc ribbon domain-containing protein [Leptospira andrefontaineae]